MIKKENISEIEWIREETNDKGATAKVFLSDFGHVVQLHKAETWNDLYKNAGSIRVLDPTGKIDWSGSQEYDKGITPDLAINNIGNVIEVHR